MVRTSKSNGDTALNNMSTEDLLLFLQSDIDLLEENNLELVMKITEILDERGAQSADTAKAEQDLVEFNTDYRKTDPFFDIESVLPQSNRKDTNPRKRRKAIFKPILIAAILIALIFGVSITASASVSDLWNYFVEWTEDFFHFGKGMNTSHHSEYSMEYTPFRTLLSENGLNSTILPTYLPDGYTQTEIGVANNKTLFYAKYTCGTSDIFVNVSVVEGGTEVIYEVDDIPPAVLTQNGTTFYITSNNDSCLSIWKYENLQCQVIGPSEEILYQMIDSIELEDTDYE